MVRAYIAGTGFYMPPRVVTNDDLIKNYHIDTTNEWILQRTGIEARRYADEGVGTSDLALPAALDAIARAGLAPEDIEMILFATLSPEHAFPGAGVYLQAKLGIPGVPAMDIRNQCSGFLYGLGTAASMIQSGAYKHILLVGAEIHSAALQLSTEGRTVASLFGDGAGAVVLSATDDDTRGVLSWHLGADGRFADVLSQKIWDMRKRPFVHIDENGNGVIKPDHLWAQMDGRQVFKNAIEKMITSIIGMCWNNKLDVNDVDLVVCHQANMRINQMVQQQLGLPEEKVPHNIHKYGNTTAATIPILLAELERDGRLQKGMNVITVGFGSGFTWGSALIRW